MLAAVVCALALSAASGPAQDTPSSPTPDPAAAPSPDPAAATAAETASAAEADDDTEPLRLLILDLQAQPEDKAAAELLSSLLAEMASQAKGLEVNTSTDLRRLMALEAEKAAMGCDAESCLGEIAGAFGVPYIVFGKLTKLGPVTTLSLSLFDAEAARPIWRKNLRAPDAVELQYELAAGAQALLAVLAERQPTVTVGTIKGPDRIDAAPATADAAAPADEGGISWLLYSGVGIAAVGAMGAGGLIGLSLALSEVFLPTFKEGGVRTVAFYGGWVALAGAALCASAAVGGLGLAGVGVVVE
jgi:hypothetical protein